MLIVCIYFLFQLSFLFSFLKINTCGLSNTLAVCSRENTGLPKYNILQKIISSKVLHQYLILNHVFLLIKYNKYPIRRPLGQVKYKNGKHIDNVYYEWLLFKIRTSTLDPNKGCLLN